MKIYLKNTDDFDNNGLGFLTDIISATVYDELNGNYYLEFEYLLNGHLSEYIEEENIVKCKVADGSEQLFIISNIEKNLKTIKITARHIFYRLMDNFLEDVFPKDLNCHAFLNWILGHTNYQNEFTGYSDITSIASARYVRKNPVEAILGDDENSMVNLFGGEIKRNNFTVNFLESIGSNKNEKLIFGKNIQEITIKEDATTILTRIMPIGFDGLILPEKYIDSSIINNYPYPKIGIVNFDDIKYDPDDESAYQDIDDAYQAMRDRVTKLYNNGIDKPSINVKINWLELSKTKEYEQYSMLERLYLGDTVTCNIAGLDYYTKVIKIVYNPLTDIVEKFEIGTPSSNIANSINNITNKMEQINPQSILEDARNSATNLITQALGGYIYKTQSELYIMDTDNPSTAQKVWRWNINGLGYSSTGINGPYGLAMTMDGQIVADFITSGKLNTNVIEGYGELVTTVSNTESAVQTLQTQSTYTIQVIDEITTNGVTKFDTGTGFTFDIEGLKINKTGSILKLILDNNGLVVYRNNDEVLRADSNGVNAENMTVRKFYVQKPIRMEKTRAISDPTKIGIGLFYVGE